MSSKKQKTVHMSDQMIEKQMLLKLICDNDVSISLKPIKSSFVYLNAFKRIVRDNKDTDYIV